MDKNTTLHFFCGKMAAGKSTLAKHLSEKHNALLLEEDNWLSQLYPEEITDIPGYIKYSSRLKNIMSEHIKLLLSHGISVVLDFPGNTPAQRNWFRGIYEQVNVSHILHFIDASDEICKRQLKERSKDKPNGARFTSEEEFDAITKYFQPPLESEGFNLIRYERKDI
ncbi:cell division protein ZipA [Okeania sp. KiyG1]|nr:cell division protein ZipA [Okeania sp. KiyG1]